MSTNHKLSGMLRMRKRIEDLEDALCEIAENEFACDCEAHSWYGKGHQTTCPIAIAKDVLEEK